MLAALLRMDAGVVRDLDVTAAYGIEAAARVRDCAAGGCRIPVSRR